MGRSFSICLISLVGAAGSLSGAELNERLFEDREITEATGFWIYNDLARGLAKARETKKPLLVHIRCIP